MKRTRLLFFALVSIFILVTVLVPHKNLAESNSSDQVRRELDGALYMETELFGTKARMPLPTEESKTRLGLLIEKYPTNRTVRQRLSIVYEELQDFEAAEKQMIAIRDNENSSIESLRLLGEFYHRRANFKKEAEILKQLMEIVPTYEKGVIFYELITLSEQHQLDNFLDESSYEKLVKEDQDGFEILKKLVERLQTKGSYNRAIKLLDSFQSLFPQEKEYFVTKKVALYLAQKDFQNAEAVYLKAFDLFWSDAMSINFYQFLRDVNRYREYKRNLVEALKKDPANFDTAMRLFHFQLKGESREKRALAVLQQLEMARTQTAGQTEWTAEELSVVAQLFVAAGELDKASRYFYTLYVRGGLEKSSTQREMMLYRLFKTLLSAKYERSVLATGDLRFYKDIATSDQNPGILGGILSLVLANSGPSDEYEKADRIADLYFNRAAAYKIFTAYKQEFPESTVLPQMYADMMRLYIDMEKIDLVNVLAKEFEQKYLGKSQYADAFAQVAEIYIQLKKPEKAVHIYQTLLDTLAKNRKEGQLLVKRSNLDSWEASSRLVNRRLSYLSSSQIFEASYEAQKRETEEGGEAGGDTSTDNTTQYQEYEYISYLTYGDKPTLFSADSLKPIVINKKLQYEEVLNSYISLLQSRRENEKIVALYWQEIQKYPTEEGLYERFLQWLSSTNLISDELKAYQLAIEKVPNNKSWQARLARWYLRQQRSEELTEISNRLVEIFDEDELQDYLEKVLDQTADKVSFYDQVLRLTLYKNALRRFPENIVFVNGLLNYYRLEKRY
ncbi:MAG: hypothetical protein JNN15_12705, partial [Blastocatellia bacterium]|nr:hypothetical protein [Blastocatellia bacterium]